MSEVIVGNLLSRKVWIGSIDSGIELTPERSQKIRNHSPDGFAWGYGGSGPSQLAMAILLEFSDEEFTSDYYMQFKWDIIAIIPQADFCLRVSRVKEWIKNKRSREI